jgi:hypothetical protein
MTPNELLPHVCPCPSLIIAICAPPPKPNAMLSPPYYFHLQLVCWIVWVETILTRLYSFVDYIHSTIYWNIPTTLMCGSHFPFVCIPFSIWKLMCFLDKWSLMIDQMWYFPQCQIKDKSQPTFKFIRPHRENACLNGWRKAKNHQWNQTKWGSTHRPFHIIVACDYNICIKYSPFQSKWNHASQYCFSLCQWMMDLACNSMHQMKN